MHLNSKVVAVEPDGVPDRERRLPARRCRALGDLCRRAGMAGEVGTRGGQEGFIAVDRDLRSSLPPRGVCRRRRGRDARSAAQVGRVRRPPGPVLSENLRRAVAGRPLKPYRPQKSFLGLISTGDTYAVASRGNWSWEGRLLWTWKDWIDRRFMQRFNELPEMAPGGRTGPGRHRRSGSDPRAFHPGHALWGLRRQGGQHGAQPGHQPPAGAAPCDVLIGLDSPDDAAVSRCRPAR